MSLLFPINYLLTPEDLTTRHTSHRSSYLASNYDFLSFWFTILPPRAMQAIFSWQFRHQRETIQGRRFLFLTSNNRVAHFTLPQRARARGMLDREGYLRISISVGLLARNEITRTSGRACNAARPLRMDRGRSRKAIVIFWSRGFQPRHYIYLMFAALPSRAGMRVE